MICSLFIVLLVTSIVAMIILCFDYHKNRSNSKIKTNSKIKSKIKSNDNSKLVKTKMSSTHSHPNINFNHLFEKIMDEYYEPNYHFNLANIPSTTNRNIFKHKYNKYIESTIKNWNTVSDICNINVKKFDIIQATETDTEFIVNAKLLTDVICQNISQPYNIIIELYGKILLADDHSGNDMCTIQLTSFKFFKFNSV